MSIQAAKAHYSEMLRGSKVEINVPEWDEVLFMRPIQFLSASVAARVKKSIAKDDAIGAGEIIQMLATTTADDTGDKFSFTKADLHDLTYNVSSEVIMRVFSEWIKASSLVGVENNKALKKP